MTPFRSVPEGYQSHWDDMERIVVSAMALEIAELVRAQTGAREPSDSDPLAGLFAGFDPNEIDDPAVKRLFPDATDDAEVAAEFRRLTQTDLALAKLRALHRWAKLLTADQRNIDHGLVIVPRAQAPEISAALTDMRLVLAHRLGLESDDDVERLQRDLFRGNLPPQNTAPRAAGVPESLRSYWASIFVAVGFAQETLVSEMLADHRRLQKIGALGDERPGCTSPGGE